MFVSPIDGPGSTGAVNRACAMENRSMDVLKESILY